MTRPRLGGPALESRRTQSMEGGVRSLALTAARQICDGSDRDADDTVIKIRCAKAQLASALPIPDQVKMIRKHLNRIENEIQATTDQLEAATKQLSELNTKSRQLTNILHDLREEISDRRRSTRRPTPTAGHAKELDTQRHSAPATASRTRRSSVTRARPTRHTKEAATRPATTAEQAIRAHRAEAPRPTQAGRATQQAPARGAQVRHSRSQDSVRKTSATTNARTRR